MATVEEIMKDFVPDSSVEALDAAIRHMEDMFPADEFDDVEAASSSTDDEDGDA